MFLAASMRANRKCSVGPRGPREAQRYVSKSSELIHSPLIVTCVGVPMILQLLTFHSIPTPLPIQRTHSTHWLRISCMSCSVRARAISLSTNRLTILRAGCTFNWLIIPSIKMLNSKGLGGSPWVIPALVQSYGLEFWPFVCSCIGESSGRRITLISEGSASSIMVCSFDRGTQSKAFLKYRMLAHGRLFRIVLTAKYNAH